jgi:hypothetical protein
MEDGKRVFHIKNLLKVANENNCHGPKEGPPQRAGWVDQGTRRGGGPDRGCPSAPAEDTARGRCPTSTTLSQVLGNLGKYVFKKK